MSIFEKIKDKLGKHKNTVNTNNSNTDVVSKEKKNMKGTVKWFSRQKGYGFIAAEDGNEYFVHYSSIMQDGYKNLSDNQSVTFDVGTSDKGRTAAINVVPQ